MTGLWIRASLGIQGVAALTAAPAGAQSLVAFAARVEVDSTSRATVRLSLRFESAAAGVVRYSLIAPSVRAVEEGVATCDGIPVSNRMAALDGALFPAFQSSLLAGCTKVDLSYDTNDASRVPLFVPDIGLAATGDVALLVTSKLPLSGHTFPRLTWGEDGIGRKQLRQVPAVIALPVVRPGIALHARSSPDLSGRPGFGWPLYGYFVGAIVFLTAFFLWARWAAGRPEPPDAVWFDKSAEP